MNSFSSLVSSGSPSPRPARLSAHSQQARLSRLPSGETPGATPTASAAVEQVSALPRSKQLQQLVSALFQALEQNQQFIALQAQQQRKGDPTTSAQEQTNDLSKATPLTEEFRQLVTQLSDRNSNHGAPFQQLQSLYQQTPWHQAYPNLPLGLLLQDLSQQLGIEPLQTDSRLGHFIDTQI